MSDEIEDIQIEKEIDKQERNVDIPPVPTDPGWSDYVLRQFTDDELINGNVTTDGCRRVVEIVLGEIIYSKSEVLQSPNPGNDNHAVIVHTVKIKKFDESIIEFGDCADVYAGNTPQEYAIHSSATASTKAEGRALRKALKLKRIMVAEEVTNMPLEAPDKINETQINFMNMMCKRNNIDVMKMLNLSKKAQYAIVNDVPYATAVLISKFLSDVQNGKKQIPDAVVGYDPNWRK